MFFSPTVSFHLFLSMWCLSSSSCINSLRDTRPNHLTYPPTILSYISSILSCCLNVSFRVLYLLVLPSIFLKYFICILHLWHDSLLHIPVQLITSVLLVPLSLVLTLFRISLLPTNKKKISLHYTTFFLFFPTFQ